MWNNSTHITSFFRKIIPSFRYLNQKIFQIVIFLTFPKKTAIILPSFTQEHTVADNLGKLLLRLSIGGMLLLHGIYKIQHGIGHIQGMLSAHHIPSVLSYGVYLGELLAPLMLILGIYSRIWAGVILINMGMALWLTNFKGITSLGAYGAWGAQSVMFFLLGALAIILLGSGKYAIKRD